MRNLTLPLCLAMGAWLAYHAHRLPDPVPADGSGARFSAARALLDVAEIARVPHPTASPANRAVRDFLKTRFDQLGLTPEVQAADVLGLSDGEEIPGAHVENLVGVLPGRDHSLPALALMAHYDSVPASPGAADDAAGVATVLETVRLLRDDARPRARDVVVLITDGEELGLLGAKAFFESHPLAKRIGFIMNLEARGSGGRAQMFQTGPRNGAIIAAFREVTPAPLASSLTGFAYAHMPNGTDFSVAKATHVQGLDYAFIGGYFDYHTSSATAAALSIKTVQDLGDQVSAMAQRVAEAPTLPPEAPEAVYSDLFGTVIVAYPASFGWVVLGVTAALLALAWRRGARRGLAGTGFLRGVALAFASVFTVGAVLNLARRAVGVKQGFVALHWLLAQDARWETALMLVAIGVVVLLMATARTGASRWRGAAVVATVGAASSLFGGIDLLGLALGALAAAFSALAYGPTPNPARVWLGLLVTTALGAAIAQALAPSIGFLFAWPALLGALAAALTTLGTERSVPAELITPACTVLSVGLLGSVCHQLHLGFDLPATLAPCFALAVVGLWGIVPDAPRSLRAAALMAIVAGFGLVAAVRVHVPWSSRYPLPTVVFYYLDRDARQASRVTYALAPDPWTSSVLHTGNAVISRVKIPVLTSREVNAAPADYFDDPSAQVDSGIVDGKPQIRVANTTGRVVGLDLRPSNDLAQVTINGLPFNGVLHAGQWTQLRWYADRATVTVRVGDPGHGKLEARYAALSETWPAAHPLPPRPADVAPFDLSDSTVVAGTTSLSW